MPLRVMLTSNGLSSRALKDEYSRMIDDMGIDKATMLYVTTAARAVGWSEQEVRNEANWLKHELNLFRIICLDVATLSEQELNAAISIHRDIHVVYVEGGNAWYLRHHMRISGFDQILRSLCDRGALYLGVSAGAIVAGASVQVAAWKGWNETKGLKGLEQVDWSNESVSAGLDICSSCSVFPHYSRKWENLVDRCVRELDHDCIVLSDGQGYVIDSEDTRTRGTQEGKRFGMKLHRNPRCR